MSVYLQNTKPDIQAVPLSAAPIINFNFGGKHDAINFALQV